MSGTGAPLHPQVLCLRMLAFGLRRVELTLAALGAVHLQLRRHLAQRLGHLVMAAAHRIGTTDGVVERGRDGIGRRAGQLGNELGDQRVGAPSTFP